MKSTIKIYNVSNVAANLDTIQLKFLHRVPDQPRITSAFQVLESLPKTELLNPVLSQSSQSEGNCRKSHEKKKKTLVTIVLLCINMLI